MLRSKLTMLKSRLSILTSQLASLTSRLSRLSLFLVALSFLVVVYSVFLLSGYLWTKSSTQNAGTLFGAIARGQSSEALGYSSKMTSREEAERAALSTCTSNCTIAVWFQDACGAVAQGNNGWGTNFGMTTDEARTKAMEACVAYNLQQECKAKLVVCSNGFVSEN